MPRTPDQRRPVTLPVTLTVAGCSATVGTITVDDGEQIGPQLAGFLDDLAAAYRATTFRPHDDEHQEVSPDGTS
ncbi:hypothetical protein SEA_PAPAYASALAD_2 [Streptomyces phage PapayaSalad]|uniref:Lipoprotein n=1 Tax=Streptomyces phage PapayaSalad TaxID=1920310 RepID=A0A1J0MCM1_9CAUD|nr:hypothetical protein HOR44_gp02 [Streptomyces phage PapayaSalad]APD18590.1 hypothetical protein SEA_PAPAYASALAD_2 [Streptomyces phage PapayaSalad]